MRFHLRKQTATSHARLDASVGTFDSIESYARYCQGLLHFRAPLEKAAAEMISEGIDGWRLLPLADALRADLNDLGYMPRSTEDASEPDLRNANHLLGMLYVLEGSALGAQILIRRAGELGLSGQKGARHLALQTHDRTNWPRFVEILDRRGASDPDEVVRGATDTFARAMHSFETQR